MTPQLRTTLERTNRDEIGRAAKLMVDAAERAHLDGREAIAWFFYASANLLHRFDRDPALVEIGRPDAGRVDEQFVVLAMNEFHLHPRAYDPVLSVFGKPGGTPVVVALARELAAARAHIQSQAGQTSPEIAKLRMDAAVARGMAELVDDIGDDE